MMTMKQPAGRDNPRASAWPEKYALCGYDSYVEPQSALEATARRLPLGTLDEACLRVVCELVAHRLCVVVGDGDQEAAR